MNISVSTLVSYLKNKLDSDNRLHNVNVKGELSNFHKHYSGHLYFTLKDEKSAINCVMFHSKASSINFEPKNGDNVEVSANVSIFETSGQLQLYVNTMKLAGIGDLYQQFEMLKTKLANDGYFDDNHKKTITCFYPSKVAVLVGDKSAAMSDIKTCFARRWPLCTVDYYPVLVQGTEAPKDIVTKLNEVDKLGYEFIILSRGGGSFEDLFCFNDEELVKTIYNLKTFIITGVGHEQDFTLVDFASDLRAPTPTAAVELITPDIIDVKESIDTSMYSLNKNINQLLDKKKLLLDYYVTRLNLFQNRSRSYSDLIDLNVSLLNKSVLQLLFNRRTKLNSLEKILNAYSLENTLKRGFSLVYKNQELIKDSSDLNNDDSIDIQLYKGRIQATVKEA